MKELAPSAAISVFLFSTGFTILLWNGDWGLALALAAICIMIAEKE